MVTVSILAQGTNRAVAVTQAFCIPPLVFCRGGTASCAPREERTTGSGRLRRLAAARKQTASREILLWMIPSEAPKALQASECSELLDPIRANCRIPAQD